MATSSVDLGKLQLEYNTKAKAFQALQNTIQNLVETSQKATGQHNETTMCKEELSRLPDGAPIYKLTGPLLIRQDRELAKTNVAQRLKLITAQLEEIDKQIEAKKGTVAKARDELIALKQQIDAAEAAASA